MGRRCRFAKEKTGATSIVLLRGGNMICMIALAEGVDETRDAKALQSIGEDFASGKLQASELYPVRHARMHRGS